MHQRHSPSMAGRGSRTPLPPSRLGSTNPIIWAAAFLLLTAGCAELGDDQVPTFEVDALWPMPLEYPYILGPVSGVTVAPDDHIIILTRQDGFSSANEINTVTGTGTCCTPSQAVLEYAPDGTLMSEWGGPDEGYPWPNRPHGIAIDPEENLWIGGGVDEEGNVDTHILKMSRSGEHLMTIGEPGQSPSNQSTTSFGGAARFSFDADAGEVYVADGYANRRVVVLDMDTGEVLRTWGAYGNEPEDGDLPAYDPAAAPADQFRDVTCAELSNDGMVYVCDRGNNRIQVFETDGTFLMEQVIAPQTLGDGAVWDIAFSTDGQQRFLYVADGMNERVHIVERASLERLTSFGIGGRVPGTFMALASVATDSQGNLFTAENGQGRRVQRFVHTGVGPLTADHLGALWPNREP